jgi:integrase/recombinase XerD
MAYQYKRESLTPDEASRLANTCQTPEEKLIVWTLLDMGLRVSELADLTRDRFDREGHRLTVYGKGGPYGSAPRGGFCRLLPVSSNSLRSISPGTRRLESLPAPSSGR